MRGKALEEFRAIEADHLLMQRIFRDAAEARQSCGNADRHARCLQLARECLHRAQFAALGLFAREERAIEKHVPPERFLEHAACHAEIREAIQQATAAFADDGDPLAALVRLNEIARLYHLHHEGLDAVCRSLLLDGRGRGGRKRQAPAGAPLAVPAFPLTGNEKLDSEHAFLLDIHERAKSTCAHAATDCTRCDEPQRHACTASAVDLLTDAIKFMVDHFRHEEELIRRHATPEEAEAHLHAHAEISRHMSQLVSDYEDNNTAMCLYRLAETLRAWLVQHVVEHDMPIARAQAAAG
jgi:hemerythrin-like metal-binding protein